MNRHACPSLGYTRESDVWKLMEEYGHPTWSGVMNLNI